MLSDHCLSCLSVTLVHCGQRIGWIEMPLGTEVGLTPGHAVLDGRPALHHGKGYSSPYFWLMSIVAKWLDGSGYQLPSCYGGRPLPRPRCVSWGPSSPTEWGTAAPQFSAHFAVVWLPISATDQLLLFLCYLLCHKGKCRSINISTVISITPSHLQGMKCKL